MISKFGFDVLHTFLCQGGSPSLTSIHDLGGPFGWLFVPEDPPWAFLYLEKASTFLEESLVEVFQASGIFLADCLACSVDPRPVPSAELRRPFQSPRR